MENKKKRISLETIIAGIIFLLFLAIPVAWFIAVNNPSSTEYLVTALGLSMIFSWIPTGYYLFIFIILLVNDIKGTSMAKIAMRCLVYIPITLIIVVILFNYIFSFVLDAIMF